MTYQQLETSLRTGRMIVIDGGTGTDIQARGVAMNDETWCAQANWDAPDVVREVHRGYVAAGAELVIANNYPTSPFLFDNLGRFDEVAATDARAVQLAREAVGDRPVAVASSFSVMRPAVLGSDDTRMVHWPEAEARRLIERKAAGLAATGCDLIMMEMMRDCDYSVWATQAAAATGLPLWVGIAVQRGPDGRLHGNNRPEFGLDEIVASLTEVEPAVILIMHTSANDTSDALQTVRRHWDGPLGAYPESGYFAMPDWQFVDEMSPQELVEFSEDWVSLGATVLGGCCGTGPQHVGALHARWGGGVDGASTR